MNNKLIEKIQKLLSLSNSSNENEAKLSMLKAQELLVKHKLFMIYLMIILILIVFGSLIDYNLGQTLNL